MTNDANANPSLTLAERIADTLAVNGVRRIFGVPGGGSSLDLIDAAADRGIEFVLCRTETAAAIMAAVTGELTSIPGVVLTGIGPGAASVVNGIAYASLERAPVVVFTDAHDQTATAPPHQIFDQPSLFGPISKAQERLSPPDGATSFERLFELAAAEPPGPVHIDLSARDAGANSPAPSPWDRASLPVPETAPLENSSELLASARRPVLIVGLQCRHDERADAANTLADSLGCPVMTTYKAKGIVPESSPLNVGLYTGAKLDNSVLAEADLILFCGVDPVEMIPGKWPHSAPVIVLSETPRLAWPFEPDIEIAAPVACQSVRLNAAAVVIGKAKLVASGVGALALT